MDGLFGLGLAFSLALGLVSIVPATFILAVAFVYVRQHRGQPVDITTGVSAYTVVLIGLGALLISLGVADLLTAILAEISASYTYGTPSIEADFFGAFQGTLADRQERDIASGMALFVAGALAVGAHMWLRGWLSGNVRFDRGVEGAWETLFALVIGLAAVGLVAQMFSDTFTRAITDDKTSAAGATIAQMFAILGLWAVYGYRALTHTGLLERYREGGPHGGEEL